MRTTSSIHRLTSWVGLAIAIIAMLTLMAQSSRAASNQLDQISGRVVSNTAVEISLLAWGAHGPQNIVTLITVEQVSTTGRFAFVVPRSRGVAATQQAGISFRGWAVRVENVRCGQIALRERAQPLRDTCEAGWLVRPWDSRTLNAPDSVTFQVLDTSGTRSNSPVPERQVTSLPVNIVQPTSLPTAAPAASPVAAASPTADMLIAIVPTSVPPPMIPTITPVPTSEPSTPTSEDTFTPLPAPTATTVPLIVEQQPRLAISPAPTTAPAITQTPASSPTPGLALPSASVPPSATAAAPMSGGIKLEWWEWLGIGIALLVILIIGLIEAGNRLSRQQEMSRDTPSSAASVDNPIYAASGPSLGSSGHNNPTLPYHTDNGR